MMNPSVIQSVLKLFFWFVIRLINLIITFLEKVNFNE